MVLREKHAFDNKKRLADDSMQRFKDDSMTSGEWITLSADSKVICIQDWTPGNKTLSCSTQLSMKFQMLVNMTMNRN